MAVGSHALPNEVLDRCDGMIYCFGQWAYEVTNGMFWVLALLAFTVAIYLASIRLGSRRAFGFASFVGMIGAIFLAVLQFMSWWIASAFILTGIIGLAVMIMTED